MKLGGWELRAGDGGAVHVLPVDDLREHERTGHCWCRPTLDDDDDVVIHNAMDKRERHEEGDKLQ